MHPCLHSNEFFLPSLSSPEILNTISGTPIAPHNLAVLDFARNHSLVSDSKHPSCVGCCLRDYRQQLADGYIVTPSRALKCLRGK